MAGPPISAVPQENMASTNASAEMRTRQGWRASADVPSLPEAFRTVPVHSGASVWRKLFAFAGPGYLVAVGYMDPGNWATDLGGGSKFGYTLLSVILLSNLMAMFLQALSAKLGIATGRDLAQACRNHFSRRLARVPPHHGYSAQPRDALHCHRHPGRDGDAAQSVSALEHRADTRFPASTGAQTRGHQVRGDRFDRGARLGSVYQRGHSGVGRCGVPPPRHQPNCGYRPRL